MKKKSIIPPAIIEKTREYVYSLAYSAADSNFEVNHLKEVEKNIKKLSAERELDGNTAVLIALLHDIGRTKFGIYGKGHASAGAEETMEFLDGIGMERRTCKRIARAVSNHSKKMMIHDSYSELIKDADSMTRYKEGEAGDEKDRVYLRSRYAFSGKLTIMHNHDADIAKTMIEKAIDIKGCLEKLIEEGASVALVHQIRIKIRALRSLIWYIRKDVKKNMRVTMEIMDEELKGIFRDYSKARKLHVLRKRIIEVNSSEELSGHLKKLRSREHLSIERKALKKHIDLINDISERLNVIQPSLSSVDFQKSTERMRFSQSIRKVKPDDIKSLHKLRVLCKKLIYLNEMSIIRFSDEGVPDVLCNLNGLIGFLNDNKENVAMIKKIRKNEPMLVRASLYEELMRKFHDSNETLGLINEKLFLLNIMF
ncbi:MAG: CHAD domain-containing protein [Clostridia bacterium]|nr:CHAD domain-containing protein [Clostridia bacterium]MBN2883366.1 CHAD domain-containing protein [Clostridia bacterium]